MILPNNEKDLTKFESMVFVKDEDIRALAKPYALNRLSNLNPRCHCNIRRIPQFCRDLTAIRFGQYIELFGQGGLNRDNDSGQYLFEKPNNWITINHRPSYSKFINHLLAKKSIALRGNYFPRYCVIDLDYASNRPYAINRPFDDDLPQFIVPPVE
jgi:hypothetical protein